MNKAPAAQALHAAGRRKPDQTRRRSNARGRAGKTATLRDDIDQTSRIGASSMVGCCGTAQARPQACSDGINDVKSTEVYRDSAVRVRAGPARRKVRSGPNEARC